MMTDLQLHLQMSLFAFLFFQVGLPIVPLVTWGEPRNTKIGLVIFEVLAIAGTVFLFRHFYYN